MRIGQHVKWKSLNPDSPEKWFYGFVTCYEYDAKGWATVEVDGFPGANMPIRRERLVIPQPPAKFSAKGGGDDPAGTAALMAEVA